MTSLNVSLPVPFGPPPPTGPSSASIRPGLEAGSSIDFLPLLMAHFPSVPSVPADPSLLAAASVLSGQPTGTLQAAQTAADMASAETKATLKKMMSKASNSLPPLLDSPADARPPSGPPEVGGGIVGRGLAPDPGSGPLLEELSSKSSSASRASETAFYPDRPAQTADGTPADRPGEIDQLRSFANGLKAIAIPRPKDPTEATALDADPTGKSAPDDVSGAAPQEVADTDADDSSASIAPAESKQLSKESSSASIVRPEEGRPAPLADQVHETFRTHLDQLQQQGRVEVRMDLHPPELGRMQLHMTMQDNQLNVRLVVQNDTAKHLLDQQLEPLRIRFSEMGVSLGQLDVRRDSNAPHQQPAADSEKSSSSAQTGRDTARRLRTSYAQGTSRSGLVDVIA